MKASHVYQHLEHDFMTSEMWDEWAKHMPAVADFLCENFTQRSMGVVCDFTTEIQHVYTAVFPSTDVMQYVLDTGTHDALLFVHHPAIWDIRNAPPVFQQMERALLHQFREHNIAMYALHVPLDHIGEYSTSVTLARALGMHPEAAFAPYYGALAGTFARTDIATVHDLRKTFEAAINHTVSLYQYGDDAIRGGTVAVVAGGGNNVEMLKDISSAGVNTFVTGVTVKNAFSRPAHAYAEQHGINVLGGTHYSTEKFACQAMVAYFGHLGVSSEFIEDVPMMEDL
jgi:putative NIF3 family GTP cyclohydrolase 1 type 2